MRRMLPMVLFTILLTAPWLVAAPVVTGNTLAAQTPGDAFVYLGWAGTKSIGADYDQSGIKTVLDHSNFLEIAHRLHDVLERNATPDPSSDEKKQTVEHILPLLAAHASAIYLRPAPDAAPDMSPVHFGLLCQADDDTAALRADLKKIADGSDGHVHLDEITTPAGAVLRLTDETTVSIKSALSADPIFAADMQPRGDHAALSVFINTDYLHPLLDKAIANGSDEDLKKAMPGVLDALGVNGVKCFAMTAGFDGGNWVSDAVLQTSGPRTGLLAVIEPKPIDPALSRVPSTATSVSVVNFDAALLYDTLAAAAAVNPQSDKVFHMASGVASVGLGRNLRRVILGSLGPQWVTYTDAKTHTTMVLNHPKDADNANDALVSVTFGITNEVNAQFPAAGNNVTALSVQKTIDKVDVTSVQSAIAAPIANEPAFAVKDGVLYFGFSPRAVVDAANAASVSGDHDFIHDETFAATLYRLHVPTPGSIDYCDVPQTAPRALAMWHDQQANLDTLLRMADPQMPSVQWPGLDVLSPKLSPALTIRWADDKGMYWRSTSPFPGSELLAGDTEAALAFTNTATVLIPAVQKAVKDAHHVETMDRERQICFLAISYTTQNNGKYPTDLGMLAASENDLGVFLHSGSKTVVPANLSTASAADKAKWVNENADYAWVLPPQFDPAKSNTIAMVIEKNLDDPTDMAAVGYADGHVEMLSAATVKKLVEDQKK